VRKPCFTCTAAFETRGNGRYCAPCAITRRQEREREQARRWSKANPDGRRRIRQRWADANVERFREMRHAWKRAHPEVVRQARRETKRRHPEANRSYVRARKVRKRGQTVLPINPARLKERIAYFGGRCWMCGGVGTTLDHVKPISKGGLHILANLRPACVPCNSSKGARWPLAS
jgi:5-methylcytosine-specific restriction endonuclease McrA